MQYDPYGEVLTSTLPAHLTDRLFTGQRFDNSTGLYYYNARYYDPDPSASLRAGLGRFIQPDTLVPDPLNPQAWNRFSYVYNNPASYIDPSGHAIWMPLLFIGFGALAGGGLYAFHLHYTGEQYNTADLVTWMAWGAFAGATFYMLPHLVGYGLSLAGMDVIGTAVWLNRVGISAYGLMRAGQWAYAWGTVLQYGGWPVVGIALSPRYRGISAAQIAKMSLIAEEAGEIRITGRLAETRLGQARRYVAFKFTGGDVAVDWLGIPDWRNTGVLTGKPEVDLWIAGGENARLPPEIAARTMRLFNATRLDYYNVHKDWLTQSPPGWLFEPSGGVSRTFFPWQVP